MKYDSLFRCTLAGLFLCASTALADTVLCNDGRRISGEVIATADGVSVKTKFGVIAIKTWEIKEWVKEKPKAVTDPKPAPDPSSGSAGTPAPKSAAPRTPGTATKNVDALIKFGSDAILAGDYAAARDAFFDAVSIESRNVRALHGLGLSFLYLNQHQRAAHYMQRAIDASGGKPERPVILNMAMVQIAMNQPMRAVKITLDYLDANKKEADEAMLNAMGSGLFLCDYFSRRNPIWGKSADFYVQYQKVVEATKPGQKRWGVEWLPASEASAKLKAMKEADAKVDQIGDRLDDQERKVLDAKRAVYRAEVGLAKGMASSQSVIQAKIKVERELTEFNKIAREYDAAADAVVRPLFPRVLTPVAIDDLSPTTGAANFRVSMADAIYKEALDKAAKAPNPAKRPTAEPTEESKTAPAKPTPAPEAPPTPIVALRPEAGRKVRVTQYAAAFAVSENLIVTAAAPLVDAVQIDLQSTDGSALKAEVVRKDEKSGLALLRLSGGDRKLVYLNIAEAFAGGDLTCVAFPTVDLFNPNAEILGGTAESPKAGWTIKLTRHPRLAGSPLLAGGKVIGVVLAGREIPFDQLPAAGPEALKQLIGGDAGKGAPARDPAAAMLQLMAVHEFSGK